MRVIPNFRVFIPADTISVSKLTQLMASEYGPFYMRMARSKTPIVHSESQEFKIGKGITVRDGSDCTIAACGITVRMALEAAEMLQQDGISCRVLDMFSIKPIDNEILEKAARETGCIVTGYFVLGGKNDFWGLHNNVEEIRKGDADSMWKECRKNGLCISVHGYGKLFLTSSSALSVAGDDQLDEDLVGANKRRLLSAFKKNQNSKSTSRFLTNEFIKEIA